MKPLIVLVAAFAVSLAATTIITHHAEPAASARIAMSVMLLFTASGHFALTKGMTAMLPPALPYRKEIVYATGVLEITAAAGLLLPRFRAPAGWLLIVLFLLMLPANVYAATKHLDYRTGTFDGPGKGYLWFRVPLQLLFIAWTYYSAVR